MTESKPLNAGTLLTRFVGGAAMGLATVALYWSYHPVTLRTGVTVSLILAIVCGLLTLKWGYKVLEAIMGSWI